VHVLIQAFRKLAATDKPVELHLYGGLETNPNYVNHLRELAAGDARIIFHGRFDNQRVPHILHDLDVLVVPSTWYEIGPLTLMESLAAGTPVVASALGGMAERVIAGVNGLLFKSGDSDDLARQLQRLIHEPELLAQLRAGARANPPRDIESEVAQLLKIYECAATKAAQPVHAA
jgi:glycosyltransferase involved in cell wall biosynthesis